MPSDSKHNSGIGYETAQALLLKNATVYIGARSIAKGEAAIQSLKAATENEKVFLLQMDLADLPTVKKAAEEFQQFVPFLFICFALN